jgi:tetratricopeptide (TPR) repeat protein
MVLVLKRISRDAIPGAIEKAQIYRYLNEPAEAESICRDILNVDIKNQQAIRLLGLSLTEKFTGAETDEFQEADRTFQALSDEYEKLYYAGLVRERRARAELHAGRRLDMVTPLLREALQLYTQAEKIRPTGNDEAILRWNRCVRLIQSRPELEWMVGDVR